MIVIAGLVLGALIGAMTAKRRKGNLADILQYAAGYGLAFMLIGVIATIAIDRAAM